MKNSLNSYAPKKEDKFSFGLWTVGNRGRDPFGDFVREAISPDDIVALLAEVGAWGVNLHDNDLVPIDATPKERERIVASFKKACEQHHLVVPMATVNAFFDPVFRDGAYTSNDPAVRAFALQKVLRAMDLGAELGAKTFVVWSGRDGVETDSCRDPLEALKRYREALNYMARYSADRGYGYKFALEAKPNEPRANIYFPTTGHYLAFINTLDEPELFGVNPEVAHEHMAGLNCTHALALAWDAGKLFHVDLNDQMAGCYDQDFRFGSYNLKSAFFVVKFLEDVGYPGPRHFDAHAYRTEDYCGVKDFARGCMRTYLILKEKARLWKQDKKIQSLLEEIHSAEVNYPKPEPFSKGHAKKLLAHEFDRAALARKRLPYELLDQLTVDLLLGVH
ncbi:MAG TPA: xylose isomerase [Candidatus Acidoferrum sp.]|nr:xylose isomerase [Candidatus Acidoferrum sp.]